MANIIISPTTGFLNTNFQIVVNEGSDVVTISSDKKSFLKTFKAEKGIPLNLPFFEEPGDYLVEYRGETKPFHVLDAIRLGSSYRKESYLFDNFDYLIVVMKDRTHFFDTSSGKLIYTENLLSPKNVMFWDNSHVLFETDYENYSDISLFSTSTFSFEQTITRTRILSRDYDIRLIVACDESEKTVNFYSGDKLELTEALNIGEKGEYWVKDNLVFVLDDTKLHIRGLHDRSIREDISRHSIMLVTDNNYLLQRKSAYTFSYKKADDFSKSGEFEYRVPYLNAKYLGHIITPEEKYTINLFAEKEKQLIKEYSEKYSLESMIAKGIRSTEEYFPKGISTIDVVIKFMPFGGGCFIDEHLKRRELSYMYYWHVITKNEYRCTPNYNEESWHNLICINEDKISMVYCSSVVRYKDHKCIVCQNSNYVEYDKGRMVSTHKSLDDFKWDTQIPETHKEASASDFDRALYSSFDSYDILAKSSTCAFVKVDDKYCLVRLQKENDNQLEKVGIEHEDAIYMDASLSPDGRFLIYPHGKNKYALYDIQKKKEVDFISGSNVNFAKGGNIRVTEETKEGERRALIIDPYSMIRVGEEAYSEYDYYSPDGMLYGETGTEYAYFSRLTQEELSIKEVNELRLKLDYYEKERLDHGDLIADFLRQMSHETKDEFIMELEKSGEIPVSTDEIIKNYIRVWKERKKFLAKHKEEIEELVFPRIFNDIHWGNYRLKYGTVENYLLCSNDLIDSYLIYKKKYVTIGITGSDTKLRIFVYNYLEYLNYIAFSYDNRYVGIVGKPDSNGYIMLCELDYNRSMNTLELKKEHVDCTIARYATWYCAFTPQGYFGSYDSTPNTYILELAKLPTQSTLKSVSDFRIDGKSLLSFSYSGKYVALSNQGYKPISLGGIGHVPSNAIYISKVSNVDETLHLFTYQSDVRANKKHQLISAFSEDDSKFMAVSSDGVIIVYNLHFKD